MCQVRNGAISMIFQDPIASLNPVQTVGQQIVEAIRSHRDVGRREARQRAIELLKSVSLPDPETRIDDYPHRLSGGMCQRVMIAMALASRPRILIADEPTTALDATVQAQVMALLKKAQRDTGTAVVLITHNLARRRRRGAERRRDVRRADRRVGAGAPGLPRADASVHARPARRDPDRRGDRRRRRDPAPGRDPRHRAAPGSLAAGCAFARALPAPPSRAAPRSGRELESHGEPGRAAACFCPHAGTLQ